jgi:hypothetical protein
MISRPIPVLLAIQRTVVTLRAVLVPVGDTATPPAKQVTLEERCQIGETRYAWSLLDDRFVDDRRPWE